ncbi:MAG: ATP-binding protein [Candidatus Omnitrophota bacterium]|nr:ATP-binding protein [Candidatus Omnitrophota bacterium]
MFSEPVVGEKFFGRDEVLDLLNKRVSALKDGYRQNVALTGQSLAGKTSILHHFLYSIKEEEFITIYVEVVKEPFRAFTNRFIATLLYNALTKTGEDAGFELDNLLGKAQESLPKTYAAIKNINSLVEKSDHEAAYFNLLGLTSTLKEEIKKSCVVILDEFDNLEYIGIKNPFLNFGKVIMIQKDTMYIVSSSRNQVFKKILSEKLSLLFGNFEIVKVSGFDMENAKRFVDMRLGGFEIDNALKRFLVVFTDGNPFYLNHIAKKAKDLATEKMSNHIDTDILTKAIIETVYDSSGVIHQYLMNFILDLLDSRHKDRHLSILTSISSGRNKLADIAKSVKAKQSEVSKDLAQLSELGLVSKFGIFYKIDDSMLEFWLGKVYQKRKNLLVDGIFNRSELFTSQVKAYISDFITESEKEITARLSELFNSFSNELIQVDSRQLRLPHFTKVEVRALSDENRCLAATFRGNTWLVQAYTHVVNENDIVEYIKNVKPLTYKISNKIVISLCGIDENAKLLAKELKISIWDISTINNILNSYGKTKVIV